MLAAKHLAPRAPTLLFFLSVAAIVPLAALLSHSTEAVASKTGDAIGGLLNATLGNLTELVIAITALRAGMFELVKASIAGAIGANTLFMLGASLFLGGLRHRLQEYNPVVFPRHAPRVLRQQGPYRRGGRQALAAQRGAPPSPRIACSPSPCT